MFKYLRFFSVSALACAAFPAFAEKASDPCNGQTYTADNRLCTVITANRISQPLDTVGSSISIITRDEIEKRGYRNVADALKRVPGVSFAQTGGFGSITNVRLRGSDSGQVTVLIDGVRVNDPTNTEGFYDFGQLVMNDIERIEVLKGPQSSLYGANTTGGVINIITRADKENRTEGFAELGTHYTYNTGLTRSGSVGDFNYGVSGQRLSTQGYSRVAGGTESDGTRVEDLKAHVGYAASKQLSFKVSGGAGHSKGDLDGFNVDAPGFSTATTYYGVAESKLNVWDGRIQNTARLSHYRQNRKSNEPLGFYRFSTFDGNRTQATYQGDVSLRTRDVATVGVDYQRETAFTDNTSFGVTTTGVDTSQNSKSVFGQYILGITENWTASLAGRRDVFETFGPANTYRATTAYNVKATDTTFRASYGTGFKAPSLYQLYAPFYGTATLRPEKSRGYDAGVEQRLWNQRVVLGLTAFKNDYTNLITFDNATFTYQNIAETNTRGLEATAKFALLPELMLGMSHTYMLSEDEATKRSLPRRPKHSGSLTADYDINDEARIGAEFFYVTSMFDRATGNLRDKGHGSINLTGSYDIGRDFTVYTHVNNLLDNQYQDIAGYNTAGFEAFMGAKFGF